VLVEQSFPSEGHGPKRIVVDLAMDALVPGRVIYIKTVTILAEYDVVRIEYEEIPPKEPFPEGESEAAWAAWSARNAWPTSIRDDVGTEYDDWGGAEGLTADGAKTDGEFDFHPAPPAAARWLELAFQSSDARNPDDPARYRLRLSLPPDGVSATPT
jgi:hypothetical protein